MTINEINDIIEENRIHGRTTTDVLHNENNELLIIYFGSTVDRFYTFSFKDKLHRVFSTYEEARRDAINSGYHR